MNVSDYLIDQDGIDWSDIFSDWGWLLPREFTVWMVNLFGDSIIVDGEGVVSFLDLGGGSLRRIAANREEFFEIVDQGNNADDWFAIPLVDQCVASGLHLEPGKCYSYTVPPVLGGQYSVENISVSDIAVHFSFLGQIHAQIRDLPDGTSVELRVEV